MKIKMNREVNVMVCGNGKYVKQQKMKNGIEMV